MFCFNYACSIYFIYLLFNRYGKHNLNRSSLLKQQRCEQPIVTEKLKTKNFSATKKHEKLKGFSHCHLYNSPKSEHSVYVLPFTGNLEI